MKRQRARLLFNNSVLPGPSRLETVNIGVALFCPECKFLQTRFGRRKSLISKLFGAQDWEFVKIQQTQFESRLWTNENLFTNLTEFENYIARWANAFRMTPPRPAKVEGDPEAELDRLFKRLVTQKADRRIPEQSSLQEELNGRFHLEGISDKLQRNVVVRPPLLPKPLKPHSLSKTGSSI